MTVDAAAPIKRVAREAWVIILAGLGIFLFVALASYNSQDPGWSYWGSAAAIHNFAGRSGAWVADILLSLLGYLAYFMPLALLVQAWLTLASTTYKFSALSLALRLLGVLLILLAGTSLLALHTALSAVKLPFGAGGIVGLEISRLTVNAFNLTGSRILLVAALLVGLTFFIQFSWLKLMDLLGKGCLKLLTISYQRLLLKGWLQVIKWLTRSTRPKLTKTTELVKQQLPQLPAVIKPKASKQPNKSGNSDTQPKLLAVKSSHGQLPPVDLLDQATTQQKSGFSKDTLTAMARLLEEKLQDFGIQVKVMDILPGPVITRFEVHPAPGIKVSRISNLSKDLARSLSVVSLRVVEVIPGKPVVGIEIPNQHREMVHLTELITADQYQQADSLLTLALGKDIEGVPVAVDLAKMPHLLVAGTTGSGKSVGVNAMLVSLLYKATPEQLRLIMIDPKMLELSVYDNIPHLLAPVVVDMKEAANALRWCVAEMERRYRLMAALGVRNLAGLNTKVSQAIAAGKPLIDPLANPETTKDEEKPVLTTLPYIVVVIDEFADMMMIVGKKVEELIARIAQKARAAGIHLILATQRPSVDVITGLIKANVPTRIGFQVSSKIDSRTILDQAGAEQLLGHGDMLYLPPGQPIPVRVHGAFVSDDEVHRVADYWRQQGEADYLQLEVEETADNKLADADGEQDPLYDQAVEFVISSRKASISSVQRRLKIGYNRAARLVETMEAAGVVSASQTNGAREVLVPAANE
jgi:S-DNA-T family DNA segregation ATPase FtsK/SpoIIIE